MRSKAGNTSASSKINPSKNFPPCAVSGRGKPMKTYIALFRGINVGGNNKLPMKELVAFPTGSTVEFWGHMVKGSSPIQMMKKGLGKALWREKEKLALASLEETLPTLKRSLTSDSWLGRVNC